MCSNGRRLSVAGSAGSAGNTGTGSDGPNGSANYGGSDYDVGGVHVNTHIGSVPGEDGSFDDGFAVYARFFKPMGITVTSAGNALWLADYGNNRIRNITCSSLTAPTFSPTELPSLSPSAEPTEAPTNGVAVGKAKNGKGKGGVGAGKAAGKGKGGAGRGKLGKASVTVGDSLSASDLSNSLSSLSTTSIVLICVFSFIGALATSYVLYYRKSFIALLVPSAAAGDSYKSPI